jgi:hypothetical protein
VTFERARALADAVLLEGYVLYPYRASSRKNRFRWAFGILAPRTWSEPGGCEPWWNQTQCLVQPTDGAAPRLEGRLRFLHLRHRGVEVGDGARFQPVPSLEVDGQLFIPWDEAEVREVELDTALAPGVEVSMPFVLPGSRQIELVRDGSGQVAGRIVRACQPVCGRVRIHTAVVEAEHRLLRVSLRVENLTAWTDPEANRDQALRGACIATHLLLSVDRGAFVSLLDPPPWATTAAADCANIRVYPVLAGEPGRRDLLLSAPIILYDHPQIAPESPGDLCDATEIDEILTLRTALLTDDEKRQARATDPRAAAIVERIESMPHEVMERLHGTVRDVHRGEMRPRSPEAVFAPGHRVVLRPGKRRTDAQDLLFAGHVATVEAVLEDLDGQTYLAVTIDADPAADLHRWYGRYHYYYLDEVEPAPAGEGA